MEAIGLPPLRIERSGGVSLCAPGTGALLRVQVPP